MQPTGEATSLTVTELCSIIESCAKASVRAFTYRELRLEFGDVATAIPTPPPPAPEPSSTETTLSDLHTKQNASALLSAELQIKEEQIAYMVLENPLLAEELIANGEMIEGDDDGEND